MAESETNMSAEAEQPAPVVEEEPTQSRQERSVRALLLPFILGLATAPSSSLPREISILINPVTRTLTVLEQGGGDDGGDGWPGLEALLREASGKQGPLPASKASIDALPVVKLAAEEGEEGLECAICLSEFDGEAKEMPCKHKFHSGCIEKWLGIHGSCPVCRYKMPEEEKEEKKKEEGSGGESGEPGGGSRDIYVHLFIARGPGGSDGASESGQDTESPLPNSTGMMDID